MNTTQLIKNITTAIINREDYTLFVPAPERDTLKNLTKADNGRDYMHDGVKGLPSRTAKLVKLGVFYIQGDYVYLHRDIYAAVKDKECKLDSLLEKLKQKTANI